MSFTDDVKQDNEKASYHGGMHYAHKPITSCSLKFPLAGHDIPVIVDTEFEDPNLDKDAAVTGVLGRPF